MKRSSAEIKAILSAAAGTHVSFYMADEWYWCPTREAVEAQLKATWIDQYRYIPGASDCDKFAALLRAWMIQERIRAIAKKQVPASEYFGWSFGEAWMRSPAHAINAAVLDTEEVMFIEPQTDGIWNYAPKNGLYFCIM